MNLMVRKKDFSLFILFSLIIILVNNSNFIEVIGFGFSILLAGVSVLGIAFSFVYIINKKTISKDLVPVVNQFLIFAVAVFLMSFHGPSLTLGLQRSFQVLSVLGVFYLFYNGGLKGRADFVLNGASHLVVLILFVNFIFFLVGVNYGVLSDYSGVLLNPNGFGMWIAILSLLFLGVNKEKKYFMIAILFFSLYLVFASASRTSLLAFSVGILIIYLPFRLLSSSFFKYSLLVFLCLTSFLIVFFTVYSDLSIYNDFVRETSGKNLKSGRDVIWPAAIEAVLHKPWFGFGSGANVSDVSDPRFSAHNAYLQTLVQNGFLGLMIMVAVIVKVYLLIYESRYSKYFRVALATFVALLIIQNFENTIFQNNLALSYPVWAIIGISFGHYHYQKKKGVL